MLALSTHTLPLQVNVAYKDQTQPLPYREAYAWISTGLWAPAGAAVTITVRRPSGTALPDWAVGSGSRSLGVQVRGRHSMAGHIGHPP